MQDAFIYFLIIGAATTLGVLSVVSVFYFLYQKVKARRQPIEISRNKRRA